VAPTSAPDYPIETERLALRPFEPGDFEELLAIHSDPEVARYVPWPARTAEDLRPVFERKLGTRWIGAEGDAMSLAVTLRSDGALIGDISLTWESREDQTGEIGFVFHPKHQGKGYALESMQVVFRLGFDDLDMHRLFGRADARNDRSTRLMERLGMRREAHFVENEFLKGEWTDEVVYAILRREWAP
jgi:RimJ/RimL family protein N-acetyltransferase